MLTARGGRTRSVVIAIAVFSGACGTNSDRASGDTTKHDSSSGAVSSAKRDPSCVSDNGGITLPDGFCAGVFADTIGRARHIAVAPNGDLFIALEYRPAAEGAGATKGTKVQSAAVALRD